ncbi:FAD-dependent oxidoreductase [Streptomyces sp. NBC_00882]|uniref:NAD(P)/FAD-dependent oxidoreductase n=1 Tax=Streptomyces TaxID=1883 RepID=UPI00386BFC0C|nr:FAD-dependent oxidoreductase [Streptomyces sp. NBC_00882]WSZ57783.1 FAD-dependent oxidoreductase [Streptomyces canus]
MGIVVVGAGAAGVQSAVALRERGYAGRVTLVGGEPHRPYDRPPLSKAVLRGRGRPQDVVFDVDFAGLGIDVRTGVTALGLRAQERQLVTSAGELPYERLVIATGADAVRLPGDEGAYVLRTLDDAERLREVLEARRDVVVIGAGWIGAEFATAAREAGCRVTVIEAGAGPLAGVLPGAVTAPMADWYAWAGAELRTGARVTGIGDGGVSLADGSPVRADAVVVGVGARPATGWLAGSGIALGARGEVLADEWLRASVPGVYAVGDCVSFPSGRFGERLAVHHWDNALQGAKAVAAHVVAGDQAAPHDPVPYFWSEQFGRFVQYAGQHGAGDTVVRRGVPDGDGGWSVCWLRGDRVTAVLTVDRPRDLAQGKRLITAATPVDPVLVADAAVALRAAVRTAVGAGL